MGDGTFKRLLKRIHFMLHIVLQEKILSVNIGEYLPDAITVEVWDEMDAHEVSEVARVRFSELLGKPVRLVYMPDSLRPVDPQYARKLLKI